METMGKRLKSLRNKRKWTIKQTADKLGLRTFSTYANWEYDRREPDQDTLIRLANLFEVTVQWLLTGDHPSIPKTNGLSPKKQAIIKELEGISDDEADFIIQAIELVTKRKKS